MSLKSSIMRFVVLFVLAVAASFAWAGSGSRPVVTNDDTGFIPIESATRAIIFPERYFNTVADGRILICPTGKLRAEYTGPFILCGEKDNQWVEMTKYPVPGYNIVGFKFITVGSSVNLILFFSK